MKTVASSLFIAALLLSFGFLQVAAQTRLVDAAILFQKAVIDSSDDNLTGKGVGDLDGDGDLDLIIGARVQRHIVWFENPTWTQRVIASDIVITTDVETADIDGDGDVDIAATTQTGNMVFYNSSNGTVWSKSVIDTLPLHDLEIADMNGDDKPDIISRGQEPWGGDGEFLHLYLQGSVGAFVRQSRSDLPTGEGLKVADIDGDGDPDIAWNPVWIENVGGALASWPTWSYVPVWHITTFIETCDVNSDGRTDILLSPSEGWNGVSTYRISYFSAPADPRTSNWTEVVVEPSALAIHHYIGCADFDLDGDVDIATAVMGGEVKVFENAGDHQTFSKHVLSTTGSHSMRIVDVDRDGLPDLCGANWEGKGVEVFYNESVSSGPSPTPSRTPTAQPTFADVPTSHAYYAEIEALYRAGFTAGCATDPLRYCPDQTMNRAESAVFVVRGVHGTEFTPPQPASARFADLPLDSWAARWADALFAVGYTAGCGTNPLVYCPWQGHTRAEGSVFYLRMLNGAAYQPQPAQGTFSDVPANHWAARGAEAAYAAGLIPACGQDPLRFCPEGPLTRGLAAYMMVQAKGLP